MEDPVEVTDFDIDFGVTESGRTTILSKPHEGKEDDSLLDDMDFSLITSGRSGIGSALEGAMTTTERSMDTIGTIGSINTDTSLITISSSIVDRMNSAHSMDTRRSSSSKKQGVGGLLLDNRVPMQVSTQKIAPPASRAASRPATGSGGHHAPPLSSSAGSSGSAFLNNLTDPAASSCFSHTPPNNIATSYEAAHFGKRARSGSISERLRVSTELEQKGMIDPVQKGILKDLIISGQDQEVQVALDQYESGDPSLLEGMVRNGTLAARGVSDIDLLGDLDLDFLNVNETEGVDGTSSFVAGSQHQQVHQTNTTNLASDGIGELDFDDQQETLESHDFGQMPLSGRFQYPHPSQYPSGIRSRSNSTVSVDTNADFRARSNSLFSALIGNVADEKAAPGNYGRWMEPGLELHSRLTRRSSAPEPMLVHAGDAMEQHIPLTAAARRELKAEEKRRAKAHKKEQKEKEKLEKKERRQQAKLEKKKKKKAVMEEDDEEEEYEPGSGRPRSMSDPNLRTYFDDNGLLEVERPEGWIGAYSPESRKVRIARFLEKRNHRVWTKTVKYDVRKNFADSRLRVKGRFVKKEDELMMRELMSLT